ncbi:hypothetical protein E2C01_052480 [Portunus trituberculatus]|uniref:Uncharacterized protein n=1 Tax=Portunus trituberculatus TaxID=210409 RepID=A0A5B7GM00_PORTR|nr:hypothetical protein [Portunus trituberculatus]
MPTALIIFDHVFLLILFLIALFFGVLALLAGRVACVRLRCSAPLNPPASPPARPSTTRQEGAADQLRPPLPSPSHLA